MAKSSHLHWNMMVYDFLAGNAEIFGKFVVLGQGGKIAVLVGGIDPFQNGMVVAHTLNDILYKFFMLDEIVAAQMKDSCSVPVDEVVELLGKPIIIGNIDDEVGEDLNRLVVVQVGLYLPDPWRFIAKDHGNPKYGGLLFGQPHHHVFYLYFEPPKNAFRQGFIMFI